MMIEVARAVTILVYCVSRERSSNSTHRPLDIAIETLEEVFKQQRDQLARKLQALQTGENGTIKASAKRSDTW